MTETEAKMKWCPMSRYVLTDDNALVSNRQGHVNDPWDSCLASECMMWRWEYTSEAVAGDKEAHFEGHPVKAEGYCGLGGKP